jgi:chromosome segregation ATPase
MSETDTPATPRMPDDNDPMAKLTRLVVALFDDMQQSKEDQREIKEQLSNLKGHISSVEQRLSVLEQGQQETNIRLSNIEGRLSTLEQKVDIMDARLKETNKLDKIIGEVSETNHRLTNIEADMTEFARRSGYDQVKIAEHGSRLQKLEKEHQGQVS